MATALRFDEIQAAVKTAIEASAFFDDIDVVANDGYKQDEIEGILENAGACVEVLLPTKATLRDQNTFSFSLDVEIWVGWRVNVTKQKEVAPTLNIAAGVVEIMSAVLKRPRHPGEEFFKLASTPLILADTDQSEVCYMIAFLRETEFIPLP